MLNNLLALTKSGLKDWLLQRVSAVFIALYVIFFIGFFITHPHLNYLDWGMLFSHPFMKLASLFVLIMLLAHAWIGIWTVLTDYVHCVALRSFIQGVIVLGFFACFVSGVLIIWG
jgi:succinate dehydrogenase / fumarate reductase, membrane anchor subunit